MAGTTTVQELSIVEAVATHCISMNELHASVGGFKHYVNVFLPQNMHALVVKLVEMYAADNIKNVTITYPQDWWEALKERFAPTWALARWPVRYKVHTVDVKAIWQGYRPPTDKYGPFLPYVLQSESCL
jgi:hypothetical protein